MIKIENVKILGWEAAIRGMRNPKNSWDKSDSIFINDGQYYTISGNYGPYYQMDNDYETIEIGPNDLELMKKLAKGGNEHAKYQRMIQVYVDITAPLGWWHDFDTYAVGTVKNSCSRRQSIFEREFGLYDFSTDHFSNECLIELQRIIKELNIIRNDWKGTHNNRYYREILDLLPMCYNQKATWMGNYQVLARVYRQRQNHIYDEFHQMCRWIESLPYSEIITGKEI